MFLFCRSTNAIFWSRTDNYKNKTIILIRNSDKKGIRTLEVHDK